MNFKSYFRLKSEFVPISNFCIFTSIFGNLKAMSDVFLNDECQQREGKVSVITVEDACKAMHNYMDSNIEQFWVLITQKLKANKEEIVKGLKNLRKKKNVKPQNIADLEEKQNNLNKLLFRKANVLQGEIEDLLEDSMQFWEFPIFSSPCQINAVPSPQTTNRVNPNFWIFAAYIFLFTLPAIGMSFFMWRSNL